MISIKQLFACLYVLTIYASFSSLQAETIKSVFLLGENRYATVEKTSFPDPTGQARPYIRTFQSGAFLDQEQSKRLIEAAFFERIRRSDRLDAAFSSLILFDAGGDYVWHRWQPETTRLRDRNARIWKITLLALTSLAWYNADRRASELASNPLLPSRAAERRFEDARNIYYGMSAITLGTFSFYTYRAYRDFSTDITGSKLELHNRTQTEIDLSLPTTPTAFNLHLTFPLP